MNDELLSKEARLRSGSEFPGYQLGVDFEERVFVKIKVRKRRRKAVKHTMLGLGAAAILMTGYLFIFRDAPADRDVIFTASADGSGIVQPLNDADPDMERKMETLRRRRAAREIPVVEDVIYASSDNRTQYAIEHVSYHEGNPTI